MRCCLQNGDRIKDIKSINLAETAGCFKTIRADRRSRVKGHCVLKCVVKTVILLPVCCTDIKSQQQIVVQRAVTQVQPAARSEERRVGKESGGGRGGDEGAEAEGAG